MTAFGGPPPKDFRPKGATRPPRNEELDVAEATDPTIVPEADPDEVRDISGRFAMKDFTGSDPGKNFMPRPVDSDLDVPDPKDWFAVASADSSGLPMTPETESAAAQVMTAPVEKANTPPKASGPSKPSS